AAESAARCRLNGPRVVDLIIGAQFEQARKIAVAPWLERHGGRVGPHIGIAEFIGLPGEKPERLVLAVVDLGNKHGTAGRNAVPVVLVKGKLLTRAILE